MIESVRIHTVKIGPHQLDSPLILAPMAGITDRPFRQLCRGLDAGLTVSEMVTSKKHLWGTKKTRLRMSHDGEATPRSVQIAGSDPFQMAEAARFNVENGADIIDINMGCPAKKVCNVSAGSALLRDEKLVSEIIQATVNAVDVPVTLKIRTGWNTENRNAKRIAKIAEDNGIQAIAIHGRTRACAFKGEAEYETIAEVKAEIDIPVIANGDIGSAEKAIEVLNYTKADGLMIGRAAQGKPWIFAEILHLLNGGKPHPGLQGYDKKCILLEHIQALHRFYGEVAGVKIARKHIGWYCKEHTSTETFRKNINRVEVASEQLRQVSEFFSSREGNRQAA